MQQRRGKTETLAQDSCKTNPTVSHEFKKTSCSSRTVLLTLAGATTLIGAISYYLYAQDEPADKTNQSSKDIITQPPTIFAAKVIDNVLTSAAAFFAMRPQAQQVNKNLALKEATIAAIKKNQQIAAEAELAAKLKTISINQSKKQIPNLINVSGEYLDFTTNLISEALPHCMPEEDLQSLLALKPNIDIDVTDNAKYTRGAAARIIYQNSTGSVQIFLSKQLMDQLNELPNKNEWMLRYLSNEMHHARVVAINHAMKLPSCSKEREQKLLPFRNNFQKDELTNSITESLNNFLFSFNFKEIQGWSPVLSKHIQNLFLYTKGCSTRLREHINTKYRKNNSKEGEFWKNLAAFVPLVSEYSTSDQDRQIMEQDSDVATLYALADQTHKHHFAAWREYHQKYMQTALEKVAKKQQKPNEKLKSIR